MARDDDKQDKEKKTPRSGGSRPAQDRLRKDGPAPKRGKSASSDKRERPKGDEKKSPYGEKRRTSGPSHTSDRDRAERGPRKEGAARDDRPRRDDKKSPYGDKRRTSGSSHTSDRDRAERGPRKEGAAKDDRPRRDDKKSPYGDKRRTSGPSHTSDRDRTERGPRKEGAARDDRPRRDDKKSPYGDKRRTSGPSHTSDRDRTERGPRKEGSGRDERPRSDRPPRSSDRVERGPYREKSSSDDKHRSDRPARSSSPDRDRTSRGPRREGAGREDRPRTDRPPRGSSPDRSGRSPRRDGLDQGARKPRFTAEEAAPRRRRKLASVPKGLAGQAPEWLLDTQIAPQISSSNVTELLERMGLKLNDDRVSSLVDHLLLVRELNREINLVSRANVDSVLMQSLWESLVPALHVAKWSRGSKVLDLGSGGGFPGLCLAIALPEMEFLLVDSRRAKTLALTSMVGDLGLTNVSVIHERAENLASHEDVHVDSVVVRAVGVLKEVAPWAEKLVRVGGTLLVWKGPEGLREFQALDRERWGLLETMPVLPHRSVMVLEYKGGGGE